MATNFPTSLDSYATLVDNVDDVLASHPNDRGDAIEALEAKVGVNSSAVTTSHDYKLRNLPTQDSTTKVTNLNADLLDGIDSASFVRDTGNETIAGIKTFSSSPVLPNSCFAVHKNGTAQTSIGAAYTLVTWSTELFDTNSNFASNVFTPTQSGKYLLSAQITFSITGTAGNDGDYCLCALYKNGSLHKQASVRIWTDSSTSVSAWIITMADANGSTDNFSVYVFTSAGGVDLDGGADSTFFSGTKVY